MLLLQHSRWPQLLEHALSLLQQLLGKLPRRQGAITKPLSQQQQQQQQRLPQALTRDGPEPWLQPSPRQQQQQHEPRTAPNPRLRSWQVSGQLQLQLEGRWDQTKQQSGL